jgi:hypothetical protein
MNFARDPAELKDVTYKCIYDKNSKMSERVMCACIYAAVRAAEIIDWWFPLKVEAPMKTQ